MSLNHITSSTTYNPWMNISCNDLKCKTFSATTQPYFELKLNAPLSITDNIFAGVTTLSTVSNVGGITYNSGTGLFTIPADGVYSIMYSYSWDSKANGVREGYIDVSGTGFKMANSAVNNVTTGDVSNTGTLNYKFLLGNTFTCRCYQTSGGNLNINEAHVIITKLS